MNKTLLALTVLLLLCAYNLSAQKKVVILGSSTAAGTGASNYDSSWAGRLQLSFRKNITAGDPDTIVINLAVGGYVTYYAMPIGYVPPAGRPAPDGEHNVTKALSFSPDIVLINFPTNDIGSGYSKNEFLNNLRFLSQQITSVGVKAYVATTQPRSQFDFSMRQALRECVDSVNNSFGANAINFWDDLATNDGQFNLRPEVNSGDGVHANNLGHRLLFERVREKNIFGSTTTPPPPNPTPGTSSKIEAESYTSMSGVQTEYTQDAGGGLNVGWIEQGDWMDYSVTVASSGTYTVNLRIATPNPGAQLQIKRSDGAVLSTVSLPNTWGWQSWQTISTTITLSAGTQTIRVQSSSSQGWNINWLEIVGGSGAGGNQSPVVNAGSDQTITLPTSSVTLNGSGSDGDGFISSYAWSKIGGPAGESISNPFGASTSVTGLAQGSYTFRLTVTDNGGASASDDVVVIVNPSSTTGSSKIEAESFTAMSGIQTEFTQDAGGGLNVGWIEQGDWMDYSVTVASSGTYTVNLRVATPNPGAQLQIKRSDGAVLSTVSLPNTWGWQSWQTISTTITLSAGTQTIRVQSSSSQGWNINWLEIVGGSSGGNQSPTVNAGGDQTITLPVNSVQLSGSAGDGDGFIASYSWSKLSGPSEGSISNASIANPTVNGLAQGSYTFRLTVTDNGGASASDDVVVIVNPSSTTGSSRIEAESFTAMSGVQTEFTQDAGGGLNVGWIEQGDWMDYSVTVASSGTYTVNLRIATPNPGAQLQIKRSDGAVLSTVSLPNTWGWQSWQTISTTITLSAGTQTIRVQSSSSQGWNINWLEIVGGNGAITLRSAAPQLSELPVSSSVSLYPNPVRDVVSLSVDNSGEGRVQVELISLSGAVVKQFSFNKQRGVAQKSLSLIGLAKGTYLMKVSMPGWTKSTQLIKQ